MIRNILRKIITNTLAQDFSWAGRKTKRCFKDLSLTKIIIQAVRTMYGSVTDNEIAESISKWLTQASLRTQRERQQNAQTDPDSQA
ncbi:hypothetical protein CAJAP_06810 [Camponotus japonicus]